MAQWTSTALSLHCFVLQKLGYTALHAAVDGGHFEVAQALLDWGADINARREGSRDTPAHMACSSAGLLPSVAVEMIDFLAARGADLQLTNHIRCLAVLANASAARPCPLASSPAGILI